MRRIARPPSDPAFLFRHGGQPPAPATGRLLDFSASLNPLGPPASVLEALRRALPAVGSYPDPECRRLAEGLGSRHGLPADRVIVGNGSNDLIHAVARAFRPRRAVIVEPTYTEYLRASLLAGAEVEHWLTGAPSFGPAPFGPGGADLVWLGNPNNPTGQLWPGEELEAWVAANPRVRFVVDEAFLPFLPDEAAHSLVAAVERLPNLVVLRSLTKLYAIPGLRLGYAVAGPEAARRLRRHIPPWSVNVLAQVAGSAALEDAEYLARTHAWLAEERGGFLRGLQDLRPGLDPLPSCANFILLRLQDMTSGQLAGRLLARGLAVRDAANFVGLDQHYVRVAVRTPSENGRLLRELHNLLECSRKPVS